MYNDNRKRKFLLVAVVGFVLLGTVIALLAAPDKSNDTSQEVQQNTVDTNNPGQTGVSYTGFDELSQYGLTAYQMEGIKYAIYQYAKQATSFAILPGSIKDAPYDRDNPTDFVQLNFNLRIDDKATYAVTVDKYVDLTNVRVYLRDSTGKLVFDSKPVDSTQLTTPVESDIYGGEGD